MMTNQEFLKGIINCYRYPDEYCAPLILDVQEIESGLLLTMADDSKWRVDATCISQGSKGLCEQRRFDDFSDS